MFVCLAAAVAAAAEPHRVLLIHSFGRDFAPFGDYSATFREQLATRSPEPVEFSEASLDIGRAIDSGQAGPFADYLVALFSQRRPHLIATFGAPAARFLHQHQERIFPGIPALFMAAETRQLRDLTLAPHQVRATITIDFVALIRNIIQLVPDTVRVGMIHGDSPLERIWIEELRRELAPLGNRLNLVWLNKLRFEELKRRIAGLPPKSALFYGLISIDAAGVPHQQGRALAELRAVTAAPIFSHVDTLFGHGIVGGPLISSRDASLDAALVALRLLRGEKPNAMDLPPRGFATPVYDWRELKAWKIPEARLPPGSEVRFREPALWQRYWWLLLGILAVILLQAGLIGFLLIKRRAGGKVLTGNTPWNRSSSL